MISMISFKSRPIIWSKN